MSAFAWLLMFAVASFLVAWIANGIVGLLSGEHPRDTGRLWLDTFLGVLAILELGWIGRILSGAGLHGLTRKWVLFLGLLCVLLFLARSCRHAHEDDKSYIRSYPVQSP